MYTQTKEKEVISPGEVKDCVHHMEGAYPDFPKTFRYAVYTIAEPSGSRTISLGKNK